MESCVCVGLSHCMSFFHTCQIEDKDSQFSAGKNWKMPLTDAGRRLYTILKRLSIHPKRSKSQSLRDLCRPCPHSLSGTGTQVDPAKRRFKATAVRATMAISPTPPRIKTPGEDKPIFWPISFGKAESPIMASYLRHSLMAFFFFFPLKEYSRGLMFSHQAVLGVVQGASSEVMDRLKAKGKLVKSTKAQSRRDQNLPDREG